EYVRTLLDQIPIEAVESVEGINEWDYFGRGRNWVAEVTDWQTRLHRIIKTTPETAHLPVLSPSLAFRENYAKLPDLSKFSDIANVHVYADGAKPGTSEAEVVAAMREKLSNEPLYTTE